MSDSLEQYTEAVAQAKHEVDVADALLRDLRSKLTFATNERETSRQKLEEARQALDQAVLEKHNVPYHTTLSDEDQLEFEKRWTKDIEERRVRVTTHRSESNSRVLEDILPA